VKLLNPGTELRNYTVSAIIDMAHYRGIRARSFSHKM